MTTLSDHIPLDIAVAFWLLVILAIGLTRQGRTARRSRTAALDSAKTDPAQAAIHLAVYSACDNQNSAYQTARVIVLAALAIVLAIWNLR